MPIIAIAVGAIGSAIGTAIGTAIGGTILGVSAATIGGVIGAGIAGGIMAKVNGGSFGKGFLMGAVGSAVGGFLKAGLGDTIGGATQLADGTTTAEMLAAQGGADFAPDALSGMGDISGVSTGMGDLGGAAQTFADPQYGSLSPEGIPLDSSPTGDLAATTTIPDFTGDAYQGAMGEQAMSNMLNANDAMSIEQGFSATPAPLNTDQFSMIPDSPLLSQDYSYAPPGGDTGLSGSQSGGGLENIGQAASSTTSGDLAPSTPAATPSTPTNTGLGGMFKTSDAWLKNNLGMPQGSTGALLRGGADSLMKMYEANKLERQVNKMAPLTFEQFSAQYSDPDAYKNAANHMAKGGHTGTLPILLAKMRDATRGRYAQYLPGAQQTQLNNKAGISGLKTSALNNLFTPYAQNLMMQGGPNGS